MYNCEIEIANLNLNWKFPFMISQLPTPNTEAFNFLIQGLRPFGLNPRLISIESPTSNMDDVSMQIKLLNYKLGLSITYSGIEVEGRDIDSDDTLQVLQILGVVFGCLEKIDSETKKGIGIVRLSLHLSFQENTAEKYISERVLGKLNGENIEPEAVVFSLDFDEFTKHFPTKITLAKSLAITNGLFLEINYQSSNPEKEFEEKAPTKFFQMIYEHYEELLSFLDLNLIVEEEN
jgi:hypothetical protein